MVVTAFCLSACFRKRNPLTSLAAVCGKSIPRSLYCLSSVETPSVGVMGAVARVCNNYGDINREIPCSISTTKLEEVLGPLSISLRARSKSITNVDLRNFKSNGFVFFFARVICLGQRRSLRYFFFFHLAEVKSRYADGPVSGQLSIRFLHSHQLVGSSIPFLAFFHPVFHATWIARGSEL